MDPLNLQVLVNASGASGERLQPGARRRSAPAATRTGWCCSRTSTSASVGPGFGAEGGAAARGRRQGRRDRPRRDHEGLRPDRAQDRRHAPEARRSGARSGLADGARLNIPVFIHTADPPEFFQPLDYKNERWLELALFRDRRYHDRSRFPSFEELMAERDRLFAKHPKTTFILAHLGWHAQRPGAARRDVRPRCRTSTPRSARCSTTSAGSRAPRTSSSSSTRIACCSGRTAISPTSIPYYWRVFETTDEYFDYYRDYHAFWKLYGMGLPDEVLQEAVLPERAEARCPGCRAPAFRD